jgi:hypothetical protein
VSDAQAVIETEGLTKDYGEGHGRSALLTVAGVVGFARGDLRA